MTRTPLLFRWLALAALADWLATRTLTRAAIHMPKTPAMITGYQALSAAGLVASSLSGLLALAALAWIAIHELRSSKNPLLAALCLSLLAGGLLFLALPPVGWAALLYQAFYLLALALLGWRAWTGLARRAERLAIFAACLALFFGKLSQFLAALYQASGWPGPPGYTQTLFNLGELLVLLSLAGLWWAYGRPASWKVWLAAALPAALFTALRLASPAMAGILSIWSTGLTLYLPWPLYTAALWLAGVTVIQSLRRGSPASWAILLLAAGGYAAQLNVQAIFGLIALWLLVEVEEQKAPAMQKETVSPSPPLYRPAR